MGKIVMYEGADEVLITTKKNEKKMKKEYKNRDWDMFDRTETDETGKIFRIVPGVFANVE